MSFLKRIFSREDSGTGFEEISEKRTTKLGYVMLFIMFVFLVGVGQTVFGDLRHTIDRPVSPSSCVSRLSTDNLAGFTSCSSQYSRTDCGCRFTEVDEKFGLQAQFTAIVPILTKIGDHNNEISQLRSNISSYSRSITQQERQYELSLQEKIAEEEVLFDRTNSQNEITNYRNQISVAERKISEITKDRDQLIVGISSQISTIQAAYDLAYEYYQDISSWYKFKVFGLMLLFVVPFFVFSTRWYLKAKRKDSPYTIIATAVMSASAILFLQVVLVFLYDILPMEWIERIISMFMTVPILRFVVYYGGVALVVAIFGGIVYYIQKRVFNPQRVARRRLKDSQCPRCSYKIHRDDKYCPSCSLQLKKTCGNCGQERSVHLKFCSVCGVDDATENSVVEE